LIGYIFCKNNNYEFYHCDFINVSKSYDEFLNLSYDEKKLKDYKGKIITINEISFDEYLNNDNNDLYFYDFCDQDKEKLNVTNDMLIADDIRNMLRNKYFEKNQKLNLNDVISVHYRKKLFPLLDSDSEIRYFKIDYFVDILNDLYKKYPSYNVKVFTTEEDEMLSKIKNIPFKKVEFYIPEVSDDEAVKSTINYMINSKILIAANSGLSFIATLYSDINNIKICPSNFWHKWPNESILIEK
jgi:hypothetical protein